MTDAPTRSRLDVIRTKLSRLVSTEARPFGFEAHLFRQLPPTSKADLSAFEELYGVTLPSEYRAFLEQISSGGAGPAYGLLPFDDAVASSCRDTGPQALARPFPFVVDHLLDPHSSSEADDLEDTAGTLVLCNEGCGYLHRLVVSGSARGQVWLDAYVSGVGIIRIAESFLDWYERWLDDALAGGDGCWWSR